MQNYLKYNDYDTNILQNDRTKEECLFYVLGMGILLTSVILLSEQFLTESARIIIILYLLWFFFNIVNSLMEHGQLLSPLFVIVFKFISSLYKKRNGNHSLHLYISKMVIWGNLKDI